MVRQEVGESHSYFGHASTSYYFTPLIIRSILAFFLRSFCTETRLAEQPPDRAELDSAARSDG